jgi:histidine phosphotransfer protein HptB
MATPTHDPIDWRQFEAARAALGPNFWRTLVFLRDEGAKAIGTIEFALRGHDAVAMIGPAELLKSEALHMGAMAVAEIAEDVEMQARDCVEWHQSPDRLIEAVVELRAAFEATVAALQKHISPLQVRPKTIPPTFGADLEKI